MKTKQFLTIAKVVEMSLSNEIQAKIDTTVKQIKSNVFKEVSRLVELSESECKKLCDAVGFVFKSGYEKRVIERVTTTETPDRDGDIVRAKGVDNKEFRIEPIVLFAHDRYNFPVGRSLKEWIDNKISGWKSWDLYLDNDIDTSGRSDLTFRMVNSGAMRGCSIGFIPINSKFDHSEKERADIGLGKYGVEFLKVKKIEHSACSVPANQEALALSLKSIDSKILKGALSKSDLDTLEKNNMLDGNMIDVFYSVLGVEKTIVIPPVIKTKVLCIHCKVEIDYDKEPEVAMGAIKCPSCSAIINQEGKFFTGDFIKKNDQPIVNLNIDMSKTNESIIEITKKITELNFNIDSIQKSLIERFNSLIAIAEKLTNAIEQKNESGKLYDQLDTKDIENILKLK